MPCLYNIIIIDPDKVGRWLYRKLMDFSNRQGNETIRRDKAPPCLYELVFCI